MQGLPGGLVLQKARRLSVLSILEGSTYTRANEGGLHKTQQSLVSHGLSPDSVNRILGGDFGLEWAECLLDQWNDSRMRCDKSTQRSATSQLSKRACGPFEGADSVLSSPVPI